MTCSELLRFAGPVRQSVEQLVTRTSASHLVLVLGSPALSGECQVGDGLFAFVAVGSGCEYRDVQELRRDCSVEGRPRKLMVPAAYCDVGTAEVASECRSETSPTSTPSLSERIRLLTGPATDNEVRLRAAEGLEEQIIKAAPSTRARALPRLRATLLRFDAAAPAVRAVFQRVVSRELSAGSSVTAEDRQALERVEAEQDRYFRSQGEYDTFSGFISLLRSRKPGRRLLGARGLFDVVGCEGPGGDQTVRLRDELIKALLVEPLPEIRFAMLATLTSQSGYTDDSFPTGLAEDGLLFRMLLADVDQEVALAAAPFLVGQDSGDPEGCDQVLFEVLVWSDRACAPGPWASPDMRSAVLSAMANLPNDIPPWLLDRWAAVVEWMEKADPAGTVRKTAKAALEELARWQGYRTVA